MTKIYDMSHFKTIEVEENFFENINTKNALRFELWHSGTELKVQYENGDEIWYRKTHGSWGFPQRLI